MAKKNNRKCIICGKKYYFCSACNSSDANKPSWYFIFDGQNCHDIYEICTKYRDKEISIDEAYDRINKLDISNLDEFAEPTRLQIEEILKHGSKNSDETEKASTVTIKKKIK